MCRCCFCQAKDHPKLKANSPPKILSDWRLIHRQFRFTLLGGKCQNSIEWACHCWSQACLEYELYNFINRKRGVLHSITHRCPVTVHVHHATPGYSATGIASYSLAAHIWMIASQSLLLGKAGPVTWSVLPVTDHTHMTMGHHVMMAMHANWITLCGKLAKLN